MIRLLNSPTSARVALSLTVVIGLIVALRLIACSGVTQPTTTSTGPPVVTGIPGAPVCGHLDDGLVHLPPSYALPLLPPVSPGQTITDPQYGCGITRLTTFGEFQANQSNYHNYSTITPFNADSSRIMLNLTNGSTFIVDLLGSVVVPVAPMPTTNSPDTPWDPANPAVFYFTQGNGFYKATISGTSVTTTQLHTFSGYTSVIAPDQEDLSDDGCKYWLVGTPSGGGLPVGILYSLCTDAVISQTLAVGVKDSGSGWHKIQIFPSGKMLMTWSNNGPGPGQGLEIYNTDGTLYWHVVDGSAHSDVGIDLQRREVLFQPVGTAKSLNACADPFAGISVIDINAKAPVNCLANGLPAYHISYRDSPKGWVLLSMFDQGSCPDYSCFDTTNPSHLISNWQSIWPLYGEELLLAKIDGSALFRLAHHRSRSAEGYGAQPRAAISRDGRFVAWDSNFDISSSGDPNYADVYLIRLH